jgi:hypothetical protein
MKILLVLAAAGLLSFDLAEQKRQYDADVPKTIVELQQFRTSSSIAVRGTAKEGSATLINLNPKINSWYLLRLNWKGETAPSDWHLENPRSGTAWLQLDGSYPTGIIIAAGPERYKCDLLGGNPSVLDQGKAATQAYFPMCGGRVYLRKAAKGHQTALESVTEFVRDKVAGGESVIAVFHHVLADRYQESGDLHNSTAANAPAVSGERPLAALIDPQYAKQRLTPSTTNLGITLANNNEPMEPGAWYPAAADSGIYVSLMRTNLVDPKIMASYKNIVGALDTVENTSLVYLIAFDMDRFEAGYSVGTVHPRVNWGEHMIPSMRNNLLPGPDGIGTIAPLVSTGLVRPDLAKKTIATFTGGYKRDHSSFMYGDFATVNKGSHYGIIENGVVFSKLQPGLATVYSLDDGTMEMKTWTLADNAMLERVRYARQNGVPLIESAGVPGQLVNKWGPGNWAGNENRRLRSIRASLAMIHTHGKKFMIYAIFSDATPNSMARVYQSYQVDYAMLTDMNALEHTYMALYRRTGSEMMVDHLLKGMNQLDQTAPGQNVPRFLGFSDNRDFFYVMHKGANR